MDYLRKFSIEEMDGRELTPEMLEWLDAVSGGTFDYEFIHATPAWEVQLKRKGKLLYVISAYETREEAVKVWSELTQQKIALAMLLGNGAQSREWHAFGDGQKRVSNSTGWTDL